MFHKRWETITILGLLMIIASWLSLYRHYTKEKDRKIMQAKVEQVLAEKKSMLVADNYNYFLDETSLFQEDVLGASSSAEITPVLKTKQESYTIAIIGDSMVETMGEESDYLKEALSVKFPNTSFTLFNYGVGSANPDWAIENFSQKFISGNRNYPKVSEVKPDIIVLGSYSYNPYTPFDINKHWLKLAELIDLARSVTSEVYLLVEIAPLEKDFGKGVGGVNWPDYLGDAQAEKIRKQLESSIGLANAKNTPLIDVYSQSKTESGWGDSKYIDKHDNIHPSIEGQEFVAKIIAEGLNLE